MTKGKKNQKEINVEILSGFINFLTPVVLLYAIFFLSEIVSRGFFAVIYSGLIFAMGILILIYANPFSHKRLLAYFNFHYSFTTTILCFLTAVIYSLILILSET